MPRLMMLTRSCCVGSAPLGVVRTLNLPVVKLRGRGRRCGAAYPSPSPFSPWHCEQYLRYRFLPDSRCASVPTSGPSACAVGPTDDEAINTATHQAAKAARDERAPRREVISSPPPPW